MKKMNIFCPKCMNEALENHEMGYRCPGCGHVVLDGSEMIMDVLTFYAEGHHDSGQRARKLLAQDDKPENEGV